MLATSHNVTVSKVSGGKSPRLRLGITLQRSLPNAYGSLNLQFATHTFICQYRLNFLLKHAVFEGTFSTQSKVFILFIDF